MLARSCSRTFAGEIEGECKCKDHYKRSRGRKPLGSGLNFRLLSDNIKIQGVKFAP